MIDIKLKCTYSDFAMGLKRTVVTCATTPLSRRSPSYPFSTNTPLFLPSLPGPPFSACIVSGPHRVTDFAHPHPREDSHARDTIYTISYKKMVMLHMP